MESIEAFFQRYRDYFRQGLKGEADFDRVASSYASAFIAASPAGIIVGQNDEQLKQAMREGFERYRRLGTKDMTLRGVRTVPIDECHSLVHAAWTALYARGTDPDVSIDFEVHYLVQQCYGEPRIFGWVSGDEEALLRQHGIL